MKPAIFSYLKAAFKRQFTTPVPGPLDMRDGTRVVVTFEDGKRVAGEYRGAAPDGTYAVLLDDGRLVARNTVELA